MVSWSDGGHQPAPRGPERSPQRSNRHRRRACPDSFGLVTQGIALGIALSGAVEFCTDGAQLSGSLTAALGLNQRGLRSGAMRRRGPQACVLMVIARSCADVVMPALFTRGLAQNCFLTNRPTTKTAIPHMDRAPPATRPRRLSKTKFSVNMSVTRICTVGSEGVK